MLVMELTYTFVQFAYEGDHYMRVVFFSHMNFCILYGKKFIYDCQINEESVFCKSIV